MKGLFRGPLVRRLFALGVLQLMLVIGTAVAIGALTHPRHPHHPPPMGPPPMGTPPHPPLDPGLYPPLLTFLCGLVIVGLGAWVTAVWVRKLLLAEKELLANVSHELRTPLARIRVALDLAAEGDAGAARASLSEIAADLGELETLVEDVLTATRFELVADSSRGAFSLHRETISASGVAQQAAERFRAAHPTRPLEVRLDPAEPLVDIDPALFRRVLDNLLENADKYSPDADAAVHLAVQADSRSVTFEVSDHGLGIADADLPHVFAPFFRGERSRDRRSGGVGLGLTLARRIAEAHGGNISIASALGQGTFVRTTLPRASR